MKRPDDTDAFTAALDYITTEGARNVPPKTVVAQLAAALARALSQSGDPNDADLIATHVRDEAMRLREARRREMH